MAVAAAAFLKLAGPSTPQHKHRRGHEPAIEVHGGWMRVCVR